MLRVADISIKAISWNSQHSFVVEHLSKMDRDQQEGKRNRDSGELGEPSKKRNPTEKCGQQIKLQANYFRLARTPKWRIYKYHVNFEPECVMPRLRNALIMQHKEKIGVFLFDGTQLFTKKNLSTEINAVEGNITLTSTTRTGDAYTLTLQFTKLIPSDDDEAIQILNLIWRKATHGLKLQQVGRDFFDAESKIALGQFNIELWPGFNTSIRKHEQDILLNCVVAHKVMRMDTVYTMLQKCIRNDKIDTDIFKKNVIGLIVLTEYNNRNYRIDDVEFTISPMTTFNKNGTPITLADYYKEKYGKVIQDMKQPILISRPKEKSIRGGDNEPKWLIPELCLCTGLSELQRKDIALKNAMKPYSQMKPDVQQKRLLDYNQRMRYTEASIGVLQKWDLDLEPTLVDVYGHRFPQEKLVFGNNKEHSVVNGGWDRECGRGFRLFQSVVALKRWYVIFPRMMEKDIQRFVDRAIELGKNMGFEISKPRLQSVANDNALATEVKKVAHINAQMMFIAVASNKNNNGDTYSSIKKVCSADYPILSQVVTKFNLTKDKGYESVVTKILIQMCSKLGGVPWSLSIPLAGVMTIGFDVSKDSINPNKSYGSLVATMDLQQDFKFFSTVSIYSNNETLSNEFSLCVRKAIIAYRGKYNVLPKKIIIYRGGVGYGDIRYVQEMEVKHLEQSLKKLYDSNEHSLQMAFMVVTKKINTRIFYGDRNPDCGTVVDEVITLADRTEFFLVSASSTQGTVSPANYNIICNTTNLLPHRLQQWTYKQAHLYFNWCGTTKVPAVLQYATKLCFLVSNYVHRVPHNELENSLHFL